MKPTDVWKNLQSRTNKSRFDPGNLDEVERRIDSQRIAENLASQIPVSGNINILRVENEASSDYIKYLQKTAQNIIRKLVLN